MPHEADVAVPPARTAGEMGPLTKKDSNQRVMIMPCPPQMICKESPIPNERREKGGLAISTAIGNSRPDYRGTDPPSDERASTFSCPKHP